MKLLVSAAVHIMSTFVNNSIQTLIRTTYIENLVTLTIVAQIKR